jgi:hypothetical protein
MNPMLRAGAAQAIGRASDGLGRSGLRAAMVTGRRAGGTALSPPNVSAGLSTEGVCRTQHTRCRRALRRRT